MAMELKRQGMEGGKGACSCHASIKMIDKKEKKNPLPYFRFPLVYGASITAAHNQMERKISMG